MTSISTCGPRQPVGEQLDQGRRCPHPCGPTPRWRRARVRRSTTDDLGIGGVDLVDHDQLRHTVARRRRRALRGRRRAGRPDQDGAVDHVQHAGRRRRPLPRSNGTPRRAGAAGCGRSRPCRSACTPRPSGVRLGARSGRAWRTARSRRAPGLGEPVEQLRLAGVGVPGDRDARHRVAPAARALGVTGRLHVLDLAGAASPSACGSGDGPVRSSSHRGHASRCRHRRPTWPPACRDIDSPQPRRRGSRYSSWASSTCALPSGSSRAGRRCRGSARSGRSP